MRQQADAWETIQRSHAIANGVFVCAVNRVGLEPGPDQGIEFWGRSFVADPGGEIIAKAGNGEEVIVVPCDLVEWTCSAPTGRFCATGASRRTGG